VENAGPIRRGKILLEKIHFAATKERDGERRGEMQIALPVIIGNRFDSILSGADHAMGDLQRNI
jgi:hypothetical protein